MKFCVNCKHYEPRTIAELCVSPKLPISLVTGKTVFALCKDQRGDVVGSCGRDAKWFEPKESSDLDDLSTIPFGR